LVDWLSRELGEIVQVIKYKTNLTLRQLSVDGVGDKL
jgi:hypothetical protein